ncbi:hypothetical protein CEXT_8851 [Caerostris extrusa]|uniref:Uncharacterized protein n=1 Tax=Caerostris extrusa TaxID=172846 RepID=A0AAV4QR77_CAEEX|nr:hypothetical protein CEXT_8851 [Caerostris extrusa]
MIIFQAPHGFKRNKNSVDTSKCVVQYEALTSRPVMHRPQALSPHKTSALQKRSILWRSVRSGEEKGRKPSTLRWCNEFASYRERKQNLGRKRDVELDNISTCSSNLFHVLTSHRR